MSVTAQLVRREVTTGPSVSIPWRRRLSLWRHGYNSRSGVLFGLDTGDPAYDQYMSDYRLEQLGDLCGQWTGVVDNKLASQLLLGSFDEHLPDLYGIVDGGRLDQRQSFVSGRCEMPTTDGVVNAFVWIKAYLEWNDALVLKPTHGYGGRGVLVCRTAPDGDADSGYRVNGEAKTTAEFDALVDGLEEYLASEFVDQADYVADLYPDTANTLRVLTLWDYERDEPFVSGAVHRIGTDESAPVDNWSHGGLSAELCDDGTLSDAAGWQSTTDDLRWYEVHPNSGTRIEGTDVPDWPSVRDRVVEMAAMFPSLPRLGWDLVLTDDEGGFRVLEVNAHAGIETLQVHRPHLQDPRTRRFYEYHGHA
ncbi:MAG: sugar-transfer associated ATP-grasp domain-containing protein [Halolamina sp.]